MTQESRAAPGGTQSIRRAVALLREIAVKAPGGGWRVTELARRCGLDRTTAHRILSCLIAEGLVTRAGERHRLGPLVFELGLAVQPEQDLRPACAASLTRIAASCGDTVFLNMRSGFDSVCLDRREGAWPVKALTVEIGARRPLAASAAGLALLMGLTEAERRAIVRENAQRLAATTGLTVRMLNIMLEESMAAGYGLNKLRVIPGVIAVAVPVQMPGEGEAPRVALSVAATAERLTPARRREIVALLRTEAAEIGRSLADQRSGDWQ